MDGQGVVAHRRFHQVDLDRRGVGAQQDRLGLADVEVHGVVHAPGRMGRRHVEGPEVVPIRFGLRAFGHFVAHAHEDVFQLVAGLGDQVQVTAGLGRGDLLGDDLGQVEAVRDQGGGTFRPGQLGPAGRQPGLERGPDTLEPPSGFLALLGIEGADRAVGPGQDRALAEPLGLDRGQVIGGRGGGNGRLALPGDLLRINRTADSHVSASSSVPVIGTAGQVTARASPQIVDATGRANDDCRPPISPHRGLDVDGVPQNR